MKKKIIEDLLNNNKTGSKTRENYIKKHYYVEYINIIKIDFVKKWTEKLFCYVNNLNCVPKCKNINCNKRVHFKKYSEGYYEYCSIQCRNSDNNLKLFGNKNPMKNEININKAKKTKFEKYGNENFININKAKKTKFEKYGNENYNNREKFKKTTFDIYGISGFTNREKAKNTSLQKYGNEYYNNREKQYSTMIERYGEIWINYAPKYNPNSIIYLDMLSEKLGLRIQHALNGGEKKFIKYWVDGYIEKYNICIEWDEKYHNGTRQKERDLKKEIFLKEKFNCDIIRINQNDFLKDIDNNTIKYVNMLLDLINIK